MRKSFEDKNSLISALREKNEILSSENARLNDEVNSLRNQVAVANQRAAIAEGQRQTAFAQSSVNPSMVLTPEQNNINKAA